MISFNINLFLYLEFYFKIKSTGWATLHTILIDWPAFYSTRASGL